MVEAFHAGVSVDSDLSVAVAFGFGFNKWDQRETAEALYAQSYDFRDT